MLKAYIIKISVFRAAPLKGQCSVINLRNSAITYGNILASQPELNTVSVSDFIFKRMAAYIRNIAAGYSHSSVAAAVHSEYRRIFEPDIFKADIIDILRKYQFLGCSDFDIGKALSGVPLSRILIKYTVRGVVVLIAVFIKLCCAVSAYSHIRIVIEHNYSGSGSVKA